ncbi:hypothetical protein ACFOMH_13200 [Paracoccus mangrovi]|uniref:Dynamin n=1 Tax=Paracoccus mangrovi TaxID=1715645 RepID=A0ABV7R440_9RHOB
MANEDPDSIPEQIRQNRPFFMVLGLAIAIAIGAFLYVLFTDPEAHDVGRNMPPTMNAPAAGAPTTDAPTTDAPTTDAPTTGTPAEGAAGGTAAATGTQTESGAAAPAN